MRPDRLGVDFAHQGGFSDLRLLEHVEIKGATTIAMIQRARHAITAGEATTVLCVFADAPLVAGRGAGSTYAQSGGSAGVRGLERASGLLGSVPTYALLAQRWLHTTGTTADTLRTVATTARCWARGNPDAVNREPLDDAGYDASPMIAEPLRLLDCARPVNGAVAVVLTGEPSIGRSRLRVRGTGRGSIRYDAVGRVPNPGSVAAHAPFEDALDQAGMTRTDLDVAELYDPFSIVTLGPARRIWFDGWRTPVGEFVRDGHTGPGGSLPTNTGGGQLSGFYLQGMTPLAEAVVQLRGGGGDRQVPDAAVALVGGIGGRLDHHAALVLERAA